MSTEAETLLDIFVPPEGLVGHSAVLIAMTGTVDFLEAAVERFSGLGPRQRAEFGHTLVYLMLDGHESAIRKAVLPPGRVPGLHEFQPRNVASESLLHAKLALLAFSASRTSTPTHLRLAVLTANFTYVSARQQLELVWVIEVPLDPQARAADRAEIAAAGAFIQGLLECRFYQDEKALPKSDRWLTKRLDVLLGAAAQGAPKRARPRFVHSLDEPLYAQICAQFQSKIRESKNLLLCGSGFYERSSGEGTKPEIFSKLEALDVFTANPRRVAIVEAGEAGAVATWAAADGPTDGWELTAPLDALDAKRTLHAKFIYVGHLRDGHVSNGWLYLGSGNLSRRGLLTSGRMPEGNIECGVITPVQERFDGDALARRLFWCPDAPGVEDDAWLVGRVGDAPETTDLIAAPPILSAVIEAQPKALRLLWREDVNAGCRVAICWTGCDWVSLKNGQKRISLSATDELGALTIRDDESGKEWTVPVVGTSGRVCWQPTRFTRYEDALAALLDFPIRPAEAVDEEDDSAGEGDGEGVQGSPSAEGAENQKGYALYAAAELIEQVAAFQCALADEQWDDWIEHLDRVFRAAFPEDLIATWGTHRIDIFAPLREPPFRPPQLTDRQRKTYCDLLDRSAHAWGLR